MMISHESLIKRRGTGGTGDKRNQGSFSQFFLPAGYRLEHLEKLPQLLSISWAEEAVLRCIRDKGFGMVELIYLCRHVVGVNTFQVHIDVWQIVGQQRRISHILLHAFPDLTRVEIMHKNPCSEGCKSHTVTLQDDVILGIPSG